MIINIIVSNKYRLIFLSTIFINSKYFRITGWSLAHFIWFYITDLVPELHIKLTWLRLKAIETVLKRYNLPVTNQQISVMQRPTSKYYKEINDLNEQIALNDWLGFPGNKPNTKLPSTIGFAANKTNVIMRNKLYRPVNDFWHKEIVPSIEDKFLLHKLYSVFLLYRYYH